MNIINLQILNHLIHFSYKLIRYLAFIVPKIFKLVIGTVLRVWYFFYFDLININKIKLGKNSRFSC